ncbi:hypothetical protein HPP92_022548 [Vanilla planifolia]|uniref:Uncharacterized protein n=1 Tax=Vanilla planifolia TaxID=51239 RepID=A0A835PVL2_VANPL|nr:hypothetical protein HPP92_022548 [Vanilla planifolia]
MAKKITKKVCKPRDHLPSTIRTFPRVVMSRRFGKAQFLLAPFVINGARLARCTAAASKRAMPTLWRRGSGPQVPPSSHILRASSHECLVSAGATHAEAALM